MNGGKWISFCFPKIKFYGIRFLKLDWKLNYLALINSALDFGTSDKVFCSKTQHSDNTLY